VADPGLDPGAVGGGMRLHYPFRFPSTPKPP
jgi:hypothetical protein